MEQFDLCICCAAEDAHWAQRLAQSLRKYQLPNNVQPQNAALGYTRVFIDDTEQPFSPATADLLRRSRCLLVICTPRARQSQAVLDRLLHFEQFRQKEGIIAVIAEGEPLDAFPPFFIEEITVPHICADGTVEQRTETVEPVASDLRGGSPRRVRQLLRYETVRIVAALLDMAPDALEQRHNRRMRQRMTAIVSAIAAVALAVGSILSFFALRALHEGQIATAQQAESLTAATRIIEELPQTFADNPAALGYVYETVQAAVQALYENGSENLSQLNISHMLMPAEGEDVLSLLRKASLLRLTQHSSDALAAYHQAAEVYFTRDAAAAARFDAVLDAFCAGDYGLGLYVAGGEAVQAGDILLALNGEPVAGTDLLRQTEGYDRDAFMVELLRHENGVLSPLTLRLLPDELTALSTLPV